MNYQLNRKNVIFLEKINLKENTLAQTDTHIDNSISPEKYNNSKNTYIFEINLPSLLKVCKN